MKLDILVFAAHPDDAELGCGGTLLAHAAQGKKVGVIDYTQGELGSNGSVETRYAEAAAAARILGLAVRENLKFSDGFFQNDAAHQLAVIQKIRQYCPEIVIANALRDRHPDHARAAELTRTACFLAGLAKVVTHDPETGAPQAAFRPKQIFHFIQSDYIEPDIVLDISPYWEQKMAAVAAYGTQFYNPNNPNAVQTFIATPEFMKLVEGRAVEFGQAIRVRYGEGFCVGRKLGVRSFFDLI